MAGLLEATAHLHGDADALGLVQALEGGRVHFQDHAVAAYAAAQIAGPGGSAQRPLDIVDDAQHARNDADAALHAAGQARRRRQLGDQPQSELARDVADRIVFLADGVVREEGPALEVLTRPRHPQTARFLRVMGAEQVAELPG